MIKCFIFDADGVISGSFKKEAVAETAKKLGFKKKAMWDAYWSVSGLASEGNFTEQKLWSMWAGKLGININRLKKVVENVYPRHLKRATDKNVLAIIDRLKKDGYKVAMLSNTSPFTSNARIRAGHHKHFDRIFVSWRLKMMKPDPRIFRHCMKELNVKPNECVFIDDYFKNVDGAKRVGMHAILFKNAKQLEKELKRYTNKTKAVLFDLDGVLMITNDANALYYRNVLVKMGYKDPGMKAAKATYAYRALDALKILTKEKSKEKLQKLLEFELDINNGIPYHFELVKVPDGARAVLGKLKKMYKLGVVTNRMGYTEPELKRMKLLDYFDLIITSKDYKRPKPHPDPLNVALKRLGIKPEEAVYVGDASFDYLAAKGAKVPFIFFPKAAPGYHGTVARSFKELPRLIDSN